MVFKNQKLRKKPARNVRVGLLRGFGGIPLACPFEASQ